MGPFLKGAGKKIQVPRQKILKVDITPYHILDVMADPGYMKHFLLRFKAAIEEIEGGSKRQRQIPWYLFYKDNPQLLYEDSIDNIKKMLNLEKSSAAPLLFLGKPRQIILGACSDWITEKTGRIPEFEILPNTVKSRKMNIEHYGHYLKDKEDGKLKNKNQ